MVPKSIRSSSRAGAGRCGESGRVPFVSWLWLSPRTAVSGGKPLPNKKTPGTGFSRVAAVALQRWRSALGAAFRRTTRRKGLSVAVFAVGRKLVALVYQTLRYGPDYGDIGEQADEMHFRQRRINGLGAASKSLGYKLVPREPVPA